MSLTCRNPIVASPYTPVRPPARTPPSRPQYLYGSNSPRSSLPFAVPRVMVSEPARPYSMYPTAATFGLTGASTPPMNKGELVECVSVSYTHLRAHETPEHLVCR